MTAIGRSPLRPDLLAMLIAASCCACQGAREGESTRRRERTLTITALSFNIRWDGSDDGVDSWSHRKDLAAAVIRSVDADVVGLQESSPAQVEDLLEALPRYRAFDDRDRSGVVSVLYRSDRFVLERAGAFWLVSRSRLSGGTRRCTWVRLVERSTGIAMRHFSLVPLAESVAREIA